MIRYVLKRTLAVIPVMLAVSLIVFILVNLSTSDPVDPILRIRELARTEENVAMIREEYNLDKPLMQRYFIWLQNLLKLDLGKSYAVASEDVFKALTSRLPATFQLALGGTFVMLLVAIPIGTLSALYPQSLIDKFGRIFTFVGSSMPNFWLGFLLILLFGVKLKILPVYGIGTLAHLILPSITLGLGMASVYARLLRASMTEILNQEYIQAARARGLSEFRVVMKHAFKNALIPLITALSINFGYILGGVVVVESVFSWPGVGMYAVQAIFDRDIPVVQGYVLMFAMIFILMNLLVDMSYFILDPKIRKQNSK
jgi:peptide/nickel transport system permease protein